MATHDNIRYHHEDKSYGESYSTEVTMLTI